MKKMVLTFGALAGIIIVAYTIIVLMVIGDFSQVTPGELETAQWLGYIRYLVLAVGVVMAMIAYRKAQAGAIGYGRLLAIGVLVALITALFVGIMEYSYVALHPDFYNQYARVSIESMRQKGASPADITAMQAEYESYAWMRSPLATGLFYLAETTVIGSIIALIAAAFIRRTGDHDSSSPVGLAEMER